MLLTLKNVIDVIFSRSLAIVKELIELAKEEINNFKIFISGICLFPQLIIV